MARLDLCMICTPFRHTTLEENYEKEKVCRLYEKAPGAYESTRHDADGYYLLLRYTDGNIR